MLFRSRGIDQLEEVIYLLKNDPNSRRIMINLWNPTQIKDMTLPPCAYCYQFYVSFKDNKKYLHTKITQRSSDISLAGGWNIASGALITYLLAKECDMEPGSLIWSPGDTHIYKNQLEDVKKMLSDIGKTNSVFPKLFIPGEKKKHICDYEYSDLLLLNYYSKKSVKLAMNA